ncbi:hypothetical protein HDU98_010207 [Podochytrium sp. JEL0797]|nr:hypothetical protein HDU98_010207 [Podochytrium sp. JEL0797]
MSNREATNEPLRPTPPAASTSFYCNTHDKRLFQTNPTRNSGTSKSFQIAAQQQQDQESDDDDEEFPGTRIAMLASLREEWLGSGSGGPGGVTPQAAHETAPPQDPSPTPINEFGDNKYEPVIDVDGDSNGDVEDDHGDEEDNNVAEEEILVDEVEDNHVDEEEAVLDVADACNAGDAPLIAEPCVAVADLQESIDDEVLGAQKRKREDADSGVQTDVGKEAVETKKVKTNGGLVQTVAWTVGSMVTGAVLGVVGVGLFC